MSAKLVVVQDEMGCSNIGNFRISVRNANISKPYKGVDLNSTEFDG